MRNLNMMEIKIVTGGYREVENGKSEKDLQKDRLKKMKDCLDSKGLTKEEAGRQIEKSKSGVKWHHFIDHYKNYKKAKQCVNEVYK